SGRGSASRPDRPEGALRRPAVGSIGQVVARKGVLVSVPGAVLAGRYRLDSVIATGGMGVVWKGWDERLERAVAVKQLRPAPGVPEAEAAVAKDRAMREARITGRLQHPHAVSVFDAV